MWRRWVCTSGEPGDLKTTDEIAAVIMRQLRDSAVTGPRVRARSHYADNYQWITAAGEHNLVVGSQARILYSDAEVRAPCVCVGWCVCVCVSVCTFPCAIMHATHSCGQHIRAGGRLRVCKWPVVSGGVAVTRGGGWSCRAAGSSRSRSTARCARASWARPSSYRATTMT